MVAGTEKTFASSAGSGGDAVTGRSVCRGIDDAMTRIYCAAPTMLDPLFALIILCAKRGFGRIEKSSGAASSARQVHGAGRKLCGVRGVFGGVIMLAGGIADGSYSA